jgi:hypothetical protein
MENNETTKIEKKTTLLTYIKKGFIIVAYLSYIAVTIMKNQNYFELGNYEYIFVFVIGVCLKLSDSTKTIEKIINVFDEKQLEELKSNISSINTNINEIKTGATFNGSLLSSRTYQQYQAQQSITPLKDEGRPLLKAVSFKKVNEPVVEDENIIYLDDLIQRREIVKDNFIITINDTPRN